MTKYINTINHISNILQIFEYLNKLERKYVLALCIMLSQVWLALQNSCIYNRRQGLWHTQSDKALEYALNGREWGV